MSIIFECARDGQRYISAPPPPGSTPSIRSTVRTNCFGKHLRASTPEGPLAYLREQGATPQNVADLSGFDLLPCLLPPDPRQGVVCGFGLTHQSKVTTPPEHDERPAFFYQGLCRHP